MTYPTCHVSQRNRHQEFWQVFATKVVFGITISDNTSFKLKPGPGRALTPVAALMSKIPAKLSPEDLPRLPMRIPGGRCSSLCHAPLSVHLHEDLMSLTSFRYHFLEFSSHQPKFHIPAQHQVARCQTPGTMTG